MHRLNGRCIQLFIQQKPNAILFFYIQPKRQAIKTRIPYNAMLSRIPTKPMTYTLRTLYHLIIYTIYLVKALAGLFVIPVSYFQSNGL